MSLERESGSTDSVDGSIANESVLVIIGCEGIHHRLIPLSDKTETLVVTPIDFPVYLGIFKSSGERVQWIRYGFPRRGKRLHI